MRSIFLSFLTIALLCVTAQATEVAPLTSGAILTVSGVSLGTSSTTILAADNSRGFLQIQNISTNSNALACTIDGTTPVVGTNGVQLAGTTTGAGGSATYDAFVPRGAVKCIGSATSTGYNIQYMP
jgi:hypothetical protein